MQKNIQEMAQEYLKTHPQVKEIMESFRMSQDEYEKALSAMSLNVKKEGATYTLTTEGNYNVNVSSAN